MRGEETATGKHENVKRADEGGNEGDEVGENPASIKTRLKIELLTSDLPPGM